MNVRYPLWLDTVRAPGGLVFAILFGLESLARASLATVIPLQALALLGDSQRVSELYFATGVAGIVGSFFVPLLLRRWRRRVVYSLGALLLIAAAVLLTGGTLTSQIIGMMVRVFGVICLHVCLNLYIMDYIRRSDFIRSEPLKMVFSAGAWTAGPAMGVYLSANLAPWAAYAFSAACAFAVLGYFWILRITDSPTVAPATGKPPASPLANIGRFFAQPRLRLAWLLVVGRSAWWSMFFVYAPLYAVTSGLSEQSAGLIVSAANFMLFSSPMFGWYSHQRGVRFILIGCFASAGLLTIAVTASAGLPWLGVTLLLAASLAMVGLDAVGNIPFLRAVRRRDRAEMTAVFSTYRDVGELAPPAVFAVLLKFFPLPAVFAASGLSLLACSGLARYLPRRM